jgi:hypothetical protein
VNVSAVVASADKLCSAIGAAVGTIYNSSNSNRHTEAGRGITSVDLQQQRAQQLVEGRFSLEQQQQQQQQGMAGAQQSRTVNQSQQHNSSSSNNNNNKSSSSRAC